MEKFGIFELLDTLSALLSGESEHPSPENGSPPPPSAGDTAFSPPAYGGAPAPVSEPPAETAPEASSTNPALSSFLSHHEAVSKKIDGKK